MYITQGLGEGEEKHRDDEEEEGEEGDQGKALNIIASPIKKDKYIKPRTKGAKKKTLVVPLFPPSPTKPRIRAALERAKPSIKKGEVKITNPSGSNVQKKKS